jgi:hypothetical protein
MNGRSGGARSVQVVKVGVQGDIVRSVWAVGVGTETIGAGKADAGSVEVDRPNGA